MAENEKKFIDLVRRMRGWQELHEKSNSSLTRDKKNKSEKEVDQMLENEFKQDSPQTKIF